MSGQVDIKKLKIGKEYKVDHSRKGVFTMEIIEIRDEWVDGIITGGKAHYTSFENPHRYAGDPITVRSTLCKFSKIEGSKE